MGKKSREKGAAGEREAAELLLKLTGVKMRRRLSQYQKAGQCDLEVDPDQPMTLIPQRMLGWVIEVKRHAKISDAERGTLFNEAVGQAAKVGGRALLLSRQDRAEWVATWIIDGWRVHAAPEAWAHLNGLGPK